MAPADLCNGERFVVLMFLSRILFSAPASLFYEALALGVLATMAFLVEISVEASNSAAERFRTRRGASSGILLGAITLPAVMFSRSIQLHRSQDLDGIKIHDIESILLQYWTSIASCLGVIISLVFSFRSSSPWKIYIKGKIGLLCIASCMIFCFLSLKFLQNVVMMWLMTHALACSTLVYHMLWTFPSCASIGEALLASSGLVIYFGNMMGHTLSKMDIFSETFNFINGSQTPISTFLQGVLLGLLLFPLFYKFLLQICNKSTFLTDLNDVGRSIIFFGSLTMLATMVVHLQMKSSLPWLFEFVLADLGKRVLLSSYWISIIGFSVVRFYKISKKSKIERILLRKYYHLVAVLMFLPALLYQPEFLDLSFGAALAVFLTLEIIRVWRIWPLGHFVHEFMSAFTDHRDSDLLIVSHFSLLLGCALPKWLTPEANDRPLAPYAGILSLGIGDTMASVVGHKYGVLRWSKTGKKTVEGTAAGITSVLLTSSVLLPHLASAGYVLSQHWWALLSAVIVSGLLEAYTAQLDNAFIPLVFFSLLCL